MAAIIAYFLFGCGPQTQPNDCTATLNILLVLPSYVCFFVPISPTLLGYNIQHDPQIRFNCRRKNAIDGTDPHDIDN